MALVPDVTAEARSITINDLQVGDPAVNSPEEIADAKKLLWCFKRLFIRQGNALPPPARGAVCDIDVGDAAPVAQKYRRLPVLLMKNVQELIQGLLHNYAKFVEDFAMYGASLYEVSEGGFHKRAPADLW
ncbi:TPA: hypothetical protein N0F65_002700 [Lagenidium giganteum]|uniref:Uncharacterized protein n=1 Tax=Lagenidium giganteum TaxID=4803 RepID=A0AAV2Z1C5_9STRA|nr:TPA: hypothetical protein N0F65_002700 [Lagenidium giganteum]